ncbi:MAG: bestrophin family ion channel [Myxococcota bacterium]
MLVRPTRSFPGTIFLFRGSAISGVWPYLLFLAVYAATITWLYPVDGFESSLTLAPFTLIGLALSIFLGFRNNACYDRWWEARKLWGALINQTRSFARQSCTLLAAEHAVQREFVMHTIAFTHALRLHLRQQIDRLDELKAFLPDAEVEVLKQQRNVPNAILHTMGERVRDMWKAGHIDTLHVPIFEGSLETFSNIQGGCERIKNTPVPIAYTMLTHRIVGVYCLALPFGVIDTVGVFTPVVVVLVSFAFLGLDGVGSQIEDPFEEDPNDLPLLALSRTIEIDLKQRIGEAELPDPVPVVDGILY